jgi:hypothetical protein
VNRVFTVAAALMLASCLSSGERLRFHGTIQRGEPFLRRLNSDLAFGLDATEWRTANCDGWHVWVGPSRDANFADLATGPLHGFSPLDICAADFRNGDNSGPNGPGPLNVNRPGKVREFRFVTTRADEEQLFKLAENPATANAILARIRFRNGSVTITRLSLGRLEPGTPPIIEQMDFVVVLDVPHRGRR